MSNAFLVLMLLLSIIPSFIGCAPTDPLTDTVIQADLIALGTITDNRSDVMIVATGNSTVKHPYTFFTLSVETVIKGDPSIREAIIRVPGGPINGKYLLPTERYFLINDHVLVSLIREDADVYTLFRAPKKNLFGLPIPTIDDGVLWIRGSATSREPLELIMGRICQVLRLNGIPNSLKEPCPEPAWPVSWPTR